jgi:hypothetical protein
VEQPKPLSLLDAYFCDLPRQLQLGGDFCRPGLPETGHTKSVRVAVEVAAEDSPAIARAPQMPAGSAFPFQFLSLLLLQ